MPVGKTWVLAEVLETKPTATSLELLTKARSLGGTVEAILLSPEAEQAAPALGEYGASTVFAGTDPAYGELVLGGPGADAVAALVAEHRPDLILVPMSYAGRDVAGRLAARLDVPVVSNALDVSADGTSPRPRSSAGHWW